MPVIRLHQVTKRYPDATYAAVESMNLDIHQGEIVTILGPSGCGKTTTLRMIAGFEPISSGEIYIGNQLVNNPYVHIPPEKRGVGMVFQDYALFPHLNVEKNICFGIQSWSRSEKKARLKEVLELVELESYAERYPHELSGGQQQRVALARALAPRPQVILLDEPFSHLDSSLREKVRTELHAILLKANTTAVIVIHDQKDAFALSDRAVVMNEGKVQQVATPKELYMNPKNQFVAQFFGKTNLIKGALTSDLKHVDTDIGHVCLSRQSTSDVQEMMLSIRPEGCRVMPNGKFSAEVQAVNFSGEFQELVVKMNVPVGEHLTKQERVTLTLYAPVDCEFKQGQMISFDFAPESVSVIEQ